MRIWRLLKSLEAGLLSNFNILTFEVLFVLRSVTLINLVENYIRTIDEAKQYLMEVPSVKNSENKEEIIETFTRKYADHGFPITQEICKNLKFDFSFEFNDSEIENTIYDIHDLALEFMDKNNVEALILTPNNGYVALYSSENEEYINKLINGDEENNHG